jgi:hypothetical protein
LRREILTAFLLRDFVIDGRQYDQETRRFLVFTPNMSVTVNGQEIVRGFAAVNPLEVFLELV